MQECLINAHEELKRVDHLIYVSLKYTRTIDVIKNIVERFISSYDCFILAMLTKLKNEGNIEEIPESPIEKAKLVKEKYPDPIVQENIDIYLLYRKIAKAKSTSSQEYRRHVTMTATLADGTVINVDIDKIYEYYKKAKEFFEYIKKLSGGND
jgi:hypothetical protein